MSESPVVASEIIYPETGIKKFFCELCTITFTHRKTLNKHLKVFHQLQVEVKQAHTCVLCEDKFRNMIVLHEHLQNAHSIPLKFVDETFYSEDDFQDWKNKIEEESLSSYIVRNSSKKKHGIHLTYYICNRSGQQKLKQNRVRNVKASGSIKSGSTCPAFIKVSTQTVDGISEIKVQYQSVHLGHDLETRALTLRKQDRENLASCLKLGIPMDKILEDAKRNISPTSRYSLLTRKHLHNIRRTIANQANNKKKTKPSAEQKARVEMSDNSIGFEDSLEIEVSQHEEIQEQLKNTVSNHEELQEHEKNAAVSTLLQLHEQNHDYSEEFNSRKRQIIDRLKHLQSRIEQWNPKCPLPEIEDYFKAMNAYLDISASSNGALHKPGTQPRKRTSKPKRLKKNNQN